MPFRDDRDALLARADALEREAERLRAENRSLRDAADAQRQAGPPVAEFPVPRTEVDRTEVDRMASRGAARRAEVPKPARLQKSRPTGRFGDLLDESMSPTWSKVTLVVGGLLMLPSWVGALLLPGLIVPGAPDYVMAVLMLVVFVGVVLGHVYGLRWLCRKVAQVEARYERRRLVALPLDFDIDGYLKVLSTAQAKKVLVVEIVFADDHAAAARKTIVDAARGGWRGVASAGWEEGTLVIRSPELETVFMGKRWWNSNVKVHRWFRRLADKVLIPIGRAYPISLVVVK